MIDANQPQFLTDVESPASQVVGNLDGDSLVDPSKY